MSSLDSTSANGPLYGYKVVDLTIWVQGSVGGQLLADLGADVIKVERPGRGDFTRGLISLYGASMLFGDRNLLWELCNRNKRSICLDLRTDAASQVFKELIRQADVFVTNFQPKTLELLGASPDALSEVNPRLIYAIGLGLGSRGGFSNLPSMDTTASAYSGFMFSTANGEEPCYPPGAFADVLGGTNLAFGIVSALLARERSNKGQIVSTSLLQSMTWLQMLNIGVPANNQQRLRSFDREEPTNPLMNVYKCSDESWIALGSASLGGQVWGRFCRAIERKDLFDDSMFYTPQSRLQNAKSLAATLREVFARKPAAAWLRRLAENEIPCAPVNRPESLMKDPGITEEGLVAMTESGTRFVRPPFDIEGVVSPSGDAPSLGAHTFSILEKLGYSSEEFVDLVAQGAVY